MAQHDHLPGRFERVYLEHHVPRYAVLLTGALIAAFVLAFTVAFGRAPGAGGETGGFRLGLDAVVHFADFTLLRGLAAVNLALIRSRQARSALKRRFEVAGVPWPRVPAVAVVSPLVMVANVRLASPVLGVVALDVVALVRGFVRDTG